MQMHLNKAEDQLVHQQEDQAVNCALEVEVMMELHQEQEQERLSKCNGIGAPDSYIQGLCYSGSLGNKSSKKGAVCEQGQDRA